MLRAERRACIHRRQIHSGLHLLFVHARGAFDMIVLASSCSNVGGAEWISASRRRRTRARWTSD